MCDIVGLVPLPKVKGYALGKGCAPAVQPAYLRVTNFPKNADKPSQTSNSCTVCHLPLPTLRAAQTNGDVEAPSSTINLTESGDQMRTNEYLPYC